MKTRYKLMMFILLPLAGFILSQCKKTEDPVYVDPLTLKLGTSATLGSYLTDKDGNTLYYFSNDAAGANNCTGGCVANWPIFFASGLTQAKLGTGLLLADFDSITSANGKQLTYKGWPLYYYAPGGVREASGQTTGENIGGVWFVAKPDYTIMIANLQLHGINGKDYTVSPTNVYTEGVGKSIYFTDQMGRTLYIFANDSANINKWTTTDAVHNASWPIYETDIAVVPSSLDKTLFSSIMVFGKKQLTYKGWPMYYFGADVDAAGKYRGFNKGVSVGASATAQTKWPILFKDMPPARHK
jgi:predicted lipoprotein with Yx(FWY)xxD motif